MVTRRGMLAGGMGSVLLPAVPRTQAAQAVEAARVVPLWPGKAPGSAGVTVQPRTVPRSATSGPEDVAHYGVIRPTLGIVRPPQPNGHALLMIPGGSYERVASAPNGGELARFLARRGFLVGTLIYRLPYDGWAAGPAAPLQDAQRAFRLLAREAGPGARTGVIGFSAGGHLAGTLASRFGEASYDAIDAIDRQPARPAFAGMFFPVITMTAPNAHAPSRRNLIGRDPDPARVARWSLEQNVPADMPPTFLAVAADDRVVSVQNSLMMFTALQAARVSSALHVFDVGGHGFGKPGDPSGPGRFWPDLFQDWLGRQKFTRTP